MKNFNRVTVLLLVLSCMSFTKSANLFNPTTNETAGITAEHSSILAQFANMSIKDMAEIRGHKLSLKEKIQFKVLQVKAKINLLAGPADMDGSWWLWFIIGFILGPIGWLLAFLLSDGYGKPALIGCLISAILGGSIGLATSI